MLDSNHSLLVRIDAQPLTTEELLGQILAILNEGNRATFLCESSMGAIVTQRIRMRLSRLRNSMDRKELPKQHFRLTSRIYPYTNRRNRRMDCVVLEKVKTRTHEISESLERMLKNADTGTNAGAKESANGGLEW